LSLDGAGDYLGGTPADIPVSTATYTIAAWVKPDAIGTRGIVGWGNYASPLDRTTLEFTGTNGVKHDWGVVNVTATDSQVATAGFDLDDGQWHHVVATNDGVQRRIYLNGVPVASGPTPLVHTVINANFRIGSVNPNAGGNFFDGLIDDVAIWDEALDASEIAQLVSGVSPLNLTEPGLIAQWEANDLVGTVANGGTVSAWSDSVSGLSAVASGNVTFHTNALNGNAVLRFEPSDGNDLLRLAAANNPLASSLNFTVAVVFSSSDGGIGSATQWSQNAGIVDASVSAVANDWGIGMTADGRVGAGIGNPDVTQYSPSGGDFSNGGAHLAILSRSGNTVTLTMDSMASGSRSDGAPTLRGATDLVFGALQTGQNFFDGDIAEVQLYNKVLDSSELTALRDELITKYNIVTPALPLQIAGELLVDLKATDPTAATETWENRGTLGDFTRIGNPIVQQVQGVTAVTLNSDHPVSGWDDAYQGPPAPVALTGDENRSIEVWAFNPNDGLQQGEETMVAWGRRGGPERSNLTFGYGNHGTWGAVGHWGAPDMPWYSTGGSPALGQWHHLVYTYDGSTARLYSDGVQTYSEAVGTLTTHDNFTINIGAQNGTGGLLSLTEGQAGSLSIANVRIHSGVLSPEAVATNYALGILLAGDQANTVADTYQINEDGNLEVAAPGVLANDTDPNNLPLTAVVHTEPEHGTLTLNANGSFTYRPNANFNGTDTFQYLADNGDVPSDPTMVTITVNPVYDPAVAVADSYVVNATGVFQATAAQGVLANDSNIDMLSLTAVLVTNNTAGTLSLQPNGSFTYNPQGVQGPQTFTYRINDGVSLSAPVTVTLLVDSAPVADNDTYSTNEDNTLVVSAANGVLQGDTDANGNTLTARLVSDVQHGTLTLAANGSFTYVPDENYFGTDTFTYHANDGDQDSNLATVTITVNAVNDAPVAVSDRFFGFENLQLIRSAAQGVLVNDLDVDSATLTATLIDPPTTGTLDFRSDGSFTYTPPAGYLGTTTFTYRISDGLLQSQIVVVDLVINSQDQQVVINEVHYNPPDNTVKAEFIELYNAGETIVDLSNWFFSDGIAYEFPAGTTMQPGAYLVVAEDPATMSSGYGVTALGPWAGALSSDGERITLRNGVADVVDEVSYGVGFPWPVASSGSGSSMELIHPSLDNDLGGSWRASAFDANTEPDPPVVLIPEFSSAKYFVPVNNDFGTNWTTTSFNDTAWSSGETGIGYETAVADYAGLIRTSVQPSTVAAGATSILVRIPFTVEDLEAASVLRLRMKYDDGFVAYINGVEVARANYGGVPTWNGVGSDHPDSAAVVFQDFNITNAGALLNAGSNNVLSIYGVNASATSSDLLILPELQIPPESESLLGGTPGHRNAQFATNAPPQARQADHSPNQPESGEETVITLKVTDPDGVENVELQYQVVLAGQYVPAFLPVPINTLIANPNAIPEKNPAYFDAANWTSLVMVDDGTGADRVAGDGTYTAVIPGQQHRTLVRYRMTVEDRLGAAAQLPYADDEALNFAYFVYDGVPDYTSNAGTFGSDVLESMPVYHVITRAEDMTQVLAYTADQIPQGPEARFVYNWPATFVYDGVVYDNIKYRLRGANGRYHGSGKRSMRFRFNEGSYFQGKDQEGNDYPTTWRTLTTGKGFDNRMTLTQGLNEALTLYLSNTIGLPASNTHWVHFRVIDSAAEAPDQWRGDFWGLNFIVETYDVRFLEAHDLEKGNLYKLINSRTDAASQQRYQGADAVSNGADHDNIEINLTGDKSAAYIDAHVNLEKYYLFHTLVEAVRHYDFWPSANKNMVYYFEPTYTQENNGLGKLWILPWDTDASWGPTWNNGHDVVYNSLFPSGDGGGDQFSTPELWPAYFNVVREVRDLLWQPDQINPLIDQFAAVIADMDRADRARWQNAPADAGNYNGLGGAGITSLASLVQDLKNFAFVGGNWPGGSVGAGGRAAFLDQLQGSNGEAGQLPATPGITYIGDPGFASNALTFQTNPFVDPQGNNTFGAMEWRVAEITDPSAPGYDPDAPLLLEWNAAWESGELTTFSNTIEVPGGVVQSGHTYRARVRVKDNTGRWSHWSSPVEFTATLPDNNAALQEFLRISEINYDPMGPSASEIIAGFDTSDDFEFIEFVNTSSSETLDLLGAEMTNGVTFSFAQSSVTSLAPGQRVVIVENIDAFRLRYGNGPLVAGEWSGGLSGSGERLVLSDASGEAINDFSYTTNGDWPAIANGDGATLVIVDTEASYADGNNWRASTTIQGTPGAEDIVPITGVVINEVLAHTDVPHVDAIELFNRGATAVDISGWFLSDGNGDLNALAKFVIPAGTILAPGQYYVVDENDFNATMGLNPNDFALSSSGDEVWLTAAVTGVPRYFVDQVEFGGTLTNVSLGRVAGSAGVFAPQHRLTFGCENGNPQVGPVVVTEVMYHPAAPTAAELGIDPTVTAANFEYIELTNTSSVSVDISQWILAGGIDFVFPAGTIVPAGQSIVVLGSPLTNPARVDVLESRYGVSISGNSRYFGGFAGRLNDEGDSVQIRQPIADPLGAYDVLIDEVRYDDQNGWPAVEANGQALKRQVATSFGSAAASWVAAAPSLATPAFASGITGDVSGDGVVNARDIDLIFDEARRSSTVLAYDLNSDSVVSAADALWLVANRLDSLPGDANLDGAVDASDFHRWNQHKFSDCGAGWASGDFNGDAVVDGSDFNVWFANRFTGEAGGAPAARAPRAALAAEPRIQPVLVDSAITRLVDANKVASRRIDPAELQQAVTRPEGVLPPARVELSRYQSVARRKGSDTRSSDDRATDVEQISLDDFFARLV
jgi:VCBS repeat-containing protein